MNSAAAPGAAREPIMRTALASDVPFVIDAVVDRNVPTLPPELKAEQEDKLAKALAEGDADAEAVLDQLQLQEVTQR